MLTKDNSKVIRHDEIVQMLNKFNVEKAPRHVNRNTFNNLVNSSTEVLHPPTIIQVSEGKFSIRIYAAVIENQQEVRQLIIANV